MSNVPRPTRAYSSPLRAESMAATRRRIVDAAVTLFSSHGYRGTTLPAIAKEAGVSVQSVHLAGPKSALLMAAFEQSFAGDEGQHSLSERPVMQEIFAMPVSEAIPAYLSFLADANAKSAGVWRALRVAAETDEEVAAMVDDLDRRRQTDIENGVNWAKARGLISEDADTIERAETWTLLVSPETFEFFTRQRKWSVERYKAWLIHSLEALVLDVQARQ